MNRRRVAAFTVLDGLVVVIAIAGLVAFALPFFARAKVPHCRIRCISNQKQVSLALRMWANDHREKLPMELWGVEGGTRDSVIAGLPLSSFLIISNELNSPKVLSCPEDGKRQRTNSFEGLTYKNLSYFIGVDASETNVNAILVGDRNISTTKHITNGLMQITAPATIGWTADIHQHQGNMAFADGWRRTASRFRSECGDARVVTRICVEREVCRK